MSAERQQVGMTQLDLFMTAFGAVPCHGVSGEGGTQAGTFEEQQTLAAAAQGRALACSDLMERIASLGNLHRAMKQVRANKGAGGVNGMTTHELESWFSKHARRLQEPLLTGSYEPQPVLGAVQTASSGKGWWRLPNSPAVNWAMSNARLAWAGLKSLLQRYEVLRGNETAGCDIARPVV